MLQKTCFFILSVSLIGCGAPADPGQQAQRFCHTLESVNKGDIDTSGLSELAGHTLVLKTLLV